MILSFHSCCLFLSLTNNIMFLEKLEIDFINVALGICADHFFYTGIHCLIANAHCIYCKMYYPCNNIMSSKDSLQNNL